MIISVASGKSGTGKTTVTVNLTLSLENVQLLDCDVEAPNVHSLLQPDTCQTRPVYTEVPLILEERCDYCGRCTELASRVFPEKHDFERHRKNVGTDSQASREEATV
jgi:MinD superfamily P-loop ATPase